MQARARCRWREAPRGTLLAPFRVHDGWSRDMRDGAPPGRHQMLGGESSDPDVIGEDAMAAHLRSSRSIITSPRPSACKSCSSLVLPDALADAMTTPSTWRERNISSSARSFFAVSAEQHRSNPTRGRLTTASIPATISTKNECIEIGDDHPERVGATQREAAGDRVGTVAELDFGEHALASGVADIGVMIENLGDRGDGHAQFSGDPFHRRWRHLSSGPSYCVTVITFTLTVKFVTS